MYLVFFPVQCVLLACIHRVFKRLDAWPKLLSLALGVIPVIVTAMASLWLTTIVFPELSVRIDVMVAIVIQATEFILFVASAFAVRHQRSVAEQHFTAYVRQLDWHETRARLESWSLDNQLAQILHCPAQAELYATVHSWKKQPESEIGVENYLEEYSESLKQQLLSTLSSSNTRSVRETIQLLTNFWSNDCSITFTQDSAATSSLEQDPAAAELIESIIQDSVSHAVVDSKANKININLAMLEDDLLQLITSNNGQAANPEPQNNSGSSQLRASALDWQLSSQGDHAALTVLIPISVDSTRAR